jgi:dihydropyrimidinase
VTRSHLIAAIVVAAVMLGAAQQPAETIIRHGLIVTAVGRTEADLRIRGGSIAEIGQNLAAPPGARAIEAKGRLVLPGGIDPHTHLMEAAGRKGDDDYTSASRAALAGGITTIGNFISLVAGEAPTATLDKAIEIVRKQAIADVILHVRAHSLPGASAPAPLPTPADLAALAERGATLKMYLIRPEFDRNVPGYLDLLRAAGSAGLLTMFHCEDYAINTTTKARMVAEGHTAIRYIAESQPVVSEEVATQRAVAMSEVTGAPIYIVHLSSERALRAAEAGMARGLPVYVETRILYLHLTKERFEGPDGGIYTGNPPLREKRDVDAIWDGLARGTVHVVATDHIGFTREEKLNPPQTIQRYRPAGNYLQENLPLLYSEGVRKGRITLEQFVAVTSTNPARLFGLFPRKGTIAVGADADVVIWGPDLKHTIRDGEQLNNGNFSIFAGWEVTGWPVVTIRRGEVVYEDGKVLGRPGSGQIAPRQHWERPWR